MAQFVITAPKKEVSSSKRKLKQQSTKSQDDEKTRADNTNKFEERTLHQKEKIKHEAEIAATTQKPK